MPKMRTNTKTKRVTVERQTPKNMETDRTEWWKDRRGRGSGRSRDKTSANMGKITFAGPTACCAQLRLAMSAQVCASFACGLLYCSHLFPIPPRCFPFPPALRSPASYIPLFILGPAPLIPSFSVVGRPASAALASSAWPCQALNGPGMSAVGPGWILLAPINFAGNYASQSKYFTPPDFFSWLIHAFVSYDGCTPPMLRFVRQKSHRGFFKSLEIVEISARGGCTRLYSACSPLAGMD